MSHSIGYLEVVDSEVFGMRSSQDGALRKDMRSRNDISAAKTAVVRQLQYGLNCTIMQRLLIDKKLRKYLRNIKFIIWKKNCHPSHIINNESEFMILGI